MRRRLIIYLSILFVSGCSGDFNLSGLMNLNRMEAQRQDMDKEIKKKEKLFFKLVGDIRDDKIREGALKEEIIYVYGEPVLARAITDKPGIKEALVYRHPTEYFSSDWVYLYFDATGKLHSWDFVTADKT